MPRPRLLPSTLSRIPLDRPSTTVHPTPIAIRIVHLSVRNESQGQLLVSGVPTVPTGWRCDDCKGPRLTVGDNPASPVSTSTTFDLPRPCPSTISRASPPLIIITSTRLRAASPSIRIPRPPPPPRVRTDPEPPPSPSNNPPRHPTLLLLRLLHDIMRCMSSSEEDIHPRRTWPGRVSRARNHTITSRPTPPKTATHPHPLPAWNQHTRPRSP